MSKQTGYYILLCKNGHKNIVDMEEQGDLPFGKCTFCEEPFIWVGAVNCGVTETQVEPIPTIRTKQHRLRKCKHCGGEYVYQPPTYYVPSNYGKQLTYREISRFKRPCRFFNYKTRKEYNTYKEATKNNNFI